MRDMVAKADGGESRAGFTLLELAVVILLIGIISAIVFPQIFPVIVYSRLEGSARHLANFGRGAMAHATLLREPITVRLDLDKQEYYAFRLVIPKSDKEEEEEPDQLALLSDFKHGGGLSSEEVSAMMRGESLSGAPAKNRGEFDPELANKQMSDKFDLFARRATQERAKNVKHEGFLDEIGPLFEKEFALDELEPVEEELMDPVLRRTTLDEDVRIEAVVVGGARYTKGVVEIELTPLGVLEDVGFHVVNADTDYFTVTWNAVSARANLLARKEALL